MPSTVLTALEFAGKITFVYLLLTAIYVWDRTYHPEEYEDDDSQSQ